MSPVKTFIVEDSVVLLDGLVAALQELTPVEVIGTAPDETTAMRDLLRLVGRVDLVIIDVFLQSGSGLGVLRSATQAELPAKRVVLTNYATSELRAKCTALGAHRVFDKSADLDDLVEYCNGLGAAACPGHDDRASGPLG